MIPPSWALLLMRLPALAALEGWYSPALVAWWGRCPPFLLPFWACPLYRVSIGVTVGSSRRLICNDGRRCHPCKGVCCTAVIVLRQSMGALSVMHLAQLS